METAIDEVIKNLKEYRKMYPEDAFADDINVAITTMQKYQKIKEIMAKRPKDMISSNPTLRVISEVIEDGNVDK